MPLLPVKGPKCGLGNKKEEVVVETEWDLALEYDVDVNSHMPKGEGSAQSKRKPFKILHYKHNPEATARHKHESQRVVQLEAEVSALKNAVTRLSDPGQALSQQAEGGNPLALLQVEKLQNQVGLYLTWEQSINL